MKRPYSHSILSAALAFFVFFLFAASAQAKMMYYTYEGTYYQEDVSPPLFPSDSVPNEIYRLGTSASYTFAIDLERPGEYIDSIGVSSTKTSYSDYAKYASYVGGTVIEGYPYENVPDGPIDEQYILFPFSSSSYGIFLKTEELELSSSKHALTIGSQATFREYYSGYYLFGNFYDESWWAILESTVTLTSISETNPYAASVSPTPIPSAILLLGVGLAGLAGVRRLKGRLQC